MDPAHDVPLRYSRLRGRGTMSSKRRLSDTPSLFELTECAPTAACLDKPADDLELRQKARREARKAEKRSGNSFSQAAEASAPPTTRSVSVSSGGYLSVGQLAERWSVGKSTIWRWCKEGDMPLPIQIGKGATRWSIGDIEVYEQSRRDTAK